MSDDNADPTGSTARIVSVYSTSWRFKGQLDDGEGTPRRLGTLLHSYEENRVQLPQLLPDRVLVGVNKVDVQLVPDVPGVAVVESAIELFRLPTNQVVFAVTLWLGGARMTSAEAAAPIAEVLERCVRAQLTINGDPAEEAVARIVGGPDDTDMFERDKLNNAPLPSLLPERHQLVFALGDDKPADRSIWEKIIFRKEPPSRPEFMLRLRTPEQLNTNGGVAVVTPYISLFYGQEMYVDASVRLSTVHAVGTSARFRYIWRQAYDQVLRFREHKQKAIPGLQTRADLEDLADNLGNLEFDLTFSVEFPLMRVETFQIDLYEAMDLGRQAATLSQMFNQLGGSLRSEITAIEVREKREVDARQRWNSIAAGVLSLLGVAVGFVIAFLGINTTEVPDPKVSMWDGTFKYLYLTAATFALLPVYLICFPYLKGYVKRFERRRATVGPLCVTAGAVLFALACAADLALTDVRAIFAAVGMAVGLFLIAVGSTLYWQRRRWLRRLESHERGMTTDRPAAPVTVPGQRTPADGAAAARRT
jgi:hypothetical protein